MRLLLEQNGVYVCLLLKYDMYMPLSLTGQCVNLKAVHTDRQGPIKKSKNIVYSYPQPPQATPSLKLFICHPQAESNFQTRPPHPPRWPTTALLFMFYKIRTDQKPIKIHCEPTRIQLESNQQQVDTKQSITSVHSSTWYFKD